MSSTLKLGALALALAQSISSSAVPRVQRRAVDASCEHTYVHKPWDDLTDDEKSGYLDANVCLMNASPQLDIQGAQNRWDEIQSTHIVQTDWIHFVGAFLPWHRYYMAVHASMLKDECGYTGPIPYWNEPYDVTVDISNASIFQSDSFGSNGVGTDECVEDGAFANLTLHITTESPSSYCLSRDFDQSSFEYSSQDKVDGCMAYDTFEEFWDCIESTPHRGGHAGTGGTMINTALSPGDPIFFLHHGYLDSLWWKWQNEDPDNRMYAIDGTNQPSQYNGDSSAYLDYDGDPGDTTTLNHTLWMVGLADNTTIYNVMNISGSTMCTEYVYPDDD